MKRVLCLILVILFILALTSCEDEKVSQTDISHDASEEISSGEFSDSIIPGGKKIEGEVTNGSFFSEGLAFVVLNNDEGKTYCINKKGEIVFKLDKELKVKNILRGFKNGYVLVDGYICSSKGVLTSPEDVGVTKFYDIALEDGYILVEKVTADYASTKKEVGVMDTSFQWVLEPSENIYSVLENSLWSTTAINTEDYYHKDVIYFDECKQYLNIKTGKLTTEPSFEEPSCAWKREGNKYYDNQGDLKIDLSEYENINGLDKFINGKALVQFKNQSAQKRYLTLINENGEFLFEPIEILSGYPDFDGNIVIVYDSTDNENHYCYDSNGNLLGSSNFPQFENAFFVTTINDGIIRVSIGKSHNNTQRYYYYDASFNPLF